VKKDQFLNPDMKLVGVNPMVGDPSVPREELIFSKLRKVLHEDGSKATGEAFVKHGFLLWILLVVSKVILVSLSNLVIFDCYIDRIRGKAGVQEGADPVSSGVLSKVVNGRIVCPLCLVEHVGGIQFGVGLLLLALLPFQVTVLPYFKDFGLKGGQGVYSGKLKKERQKEATSRVTSSFFNKLFEHHDLTTAGMKRDLDCFFCRNHSKGKIRIEEGILLGIPVAEITIRCTLIQEGKR